MAASQFMTKAFFPILILLVLLLLAIPFSEFASSVVPGWHTTIYPSGFVRSFIVLIIGVFITIGYWQVSKKADKISWTLFVTHFILTLPALIILNFPSILLDVEKNGLKVLLNAVKFRIQLAWILFIIGQIIFLIYYIRSIKSRRTSI
jgi:hypothetical protein